ncbi:MAG TPA: acyltransferase [Candidatus Sulfotelmatobacter sp.]|nr:acyltransferase [Candidatus Sulfotelmatobacter sp.]
MSEAKLKRWEILPSTGSHFDVLDGLRGVAILLVILFHCFYVNPSTSHLATIISYLIFSGWMGVPVFFVLSGFLISYPFFKEREKNPASWYVQGYARRRLAKILPPFYLSIALFIPFYWIQFHDINYVFDGLRWASGWNSYVLSLVPFNLSYWSLMVEAHFYILLPILFYLTRGLALGSSAIAIVTPLFLAPFFLRLVAWPAGMSFLPHSHTNTEISFFIQRFPLCVVDSFAFGVVFAASYVKNKPRLNAKKNLAVLGYAGAGLLVFTLCFWAYGVSLNPSVQDYAQYWSIETFKYLPTFSTFLLLFFVYDANCFGARLLSSRWLRFIGIVSFEWFLLHGPLVGWWHNIWGPSKGSIPVYVCKVVVPVVFTFCLAVLVYRYFSLPILNRVRERVRAPLG